MWYNRVWTYNIHPVYWSGQRTCRVAGWSLALRSRSTTNMSTKAADFSDWLIEHFTNWLIIQSKCIYIDNTFWATYRYKKLRYTAKSTAHPSCLVDSSREKICWWLINHFYVIGRKSYRIRRNNAKYTAITPFTVIQGHRFWYQSKAHMYNFILVNNTNLPPSLHRFQVMADYWSNFHQRQGVPHFNAFTGGDPCEYPDKLYLSRN